MCAAYSHHRFFRHVAVMPAPLRHCAGTIGVAVALAALVGFGQPLLASDLQSGGRPDRIAAVTTSAHASPLRQDARASQAGSSDPLLAQATPTAADPGDAEVLAAVALTLPESVDEAIAKAHGLQLLDRSELPSLGLRLVRYRIPDGRPRAAVIAALQVDRRVSRAQANVRYTLPDEIAHEAAPATRFGSAKERPGRVARGRPELPSGRRRAAVAPTVRKNAPAEPASLAGAVAAPGAGSSRASQRKRSLASGGQAALRWPTADEPFVNVGATRR